MRAEGIGRGASLLSAGARFERSPGWVARLIAPGFHKLLDRIDAGQAMPPDVDTDADYERLLEIWNARTEE